MAFPRVPASQIRAPLPAIPPPSAILPMRNGGRNGGGGNSQHPNSAAAHHHHHRFTHQPPHHVNPMMGPGIAFNRQGSSYTSALSEQQFLASRFQNDAGYNQAFSQVPTQYASPYLYTSYSSTYHQSTAQSYYPSYPIPSQLCQEKDKTEETLGMSFKPDRRVAELLICPLKMFPHLFHFESYI